MRFWLESNKKDNGKERQGGLCLSQYKIVLLKHAAQSQSSLAFLAYVFLAWFLSESDWNWTRILLGLHGSLFCLILIQEHIKLSKNLPWTHLLLYVWFKIESDLRGAMGDAREDSASIWFRFELRQTKRGQGMPTRIRVEFRFDSGSFSMRFWLESNKKDNGKERQGGLCLSQYKIVMLKHAAQSQSSLAFLAVVLLDYN